MKLPAALVPHPPSGPRGALLAYLDELEGWSHRVWSAAGLRRHWLPEAVRNELHHQWWSASSVPPAQALRARVATFWAGVIPWIVCNPEAEPLPDPPPDPPLIREMVATLQREIDRTGRTLVGSQRSAGLSGAIRRLEELSSGLRGPAERAR